MRPSPGFLNVLQQLQLRVRRAVASTGIGERRSRTKGAGMEFADYRLYSPGDDTRHLDARLYARLGEFQVREYEVLKQLPVTIVIDGSRSMAQGEPGKLDVAKWLANTLGYLVLAGGDQAQIAFWSGSRLLFSPRFRGLRRAERLFEWVEARTTEGSAPFDTALGEAASRTHRESLTLILSDFWIDSPRRALQVFAAGDAEIWAFHILAPEELEPLSRQGGEFRLLDAESGEELLVAPGDDLGARYREALSQWRQELAEAVTSAKGTLIEVVSSDDLEKAVVGLRIRGLLT